LFLLTVGESNGSCCSKTAVEYAHVSIKFPQDVSKNNDRTTLNNYDVVSRQTLVKAANAVINVSVKQTRSEMFVLDHRKLERVAF